MPTLTATKLSIQRGDNLLCQGVCFSLLPGQIMHISGPNGIGKTTLLMLLAGLLPDTQGALSWDGRSPQDWHTLYIGYLPGMNMHLSVLENLRFLQALDASTGDPEQALHNVGLLAYATQPVATLSSGQRRRLALARLWLCSHARRLWLLDEPFVALDATMNRKLLRCLQAHAEAGGMVILTSHQSLDLPAQALDLRMFLPA